MNPIDPIISRRAFLAGGAAALALSGCSKFGAVERGADVPVVAGPGASATMATTKGARPFEVGISVYGWDLHDEGVEKVLDNLQMAAVNNVYIVGLMHPEKRPATTAVYPHNPVRQAWTAEDSRVYWQPEMGRYGRIKPLLSVNDWLNKTDWVELLATAVRKRGLSTGVEMSHSLVDRARAEGALADCAQRDIRGRISQNHFRPACMNHPDVREYILALYGELSERYDVDLIMSANIPFDEGGPATGGCFCPSCHKMAAAEGYDMAAGQAALLVNAAAEPHASRWRQFRFDCTGRLYKEIHEVVHAKRKNRTDVDMRFSLFMKTRNPGDWGVEPSTLMKSLDSIRVQEYSEETGDARQLLVKRQYLTDIARQLGHVAATTGPAGSMSAAGFRFNSAVAVRPKSTPELIKAGIAIAKECGASGITLAQYDGADFGLLRAVKEGLAAAGVGVG